MGRRIADKAQSGKCNQIKYHNIIVDQHLVMTWILKDWQTAWPKAARRASFRAPLPRADCSSRAFWQIKQVGFLILTLVELPCATGKTLAVSLLSPDLGDKHLKVKPCLAQQFPQIDPNQFYLRKESLQRWAELLFSSLYLPAWCWHFILFSFLKAGENSLLETDLSLKPRCLCWPFLSPNITEPSGVLWKVARLQKSELSKPRLSSGI